MPLIPLIAYLTADASQRWRTMIDRRGGPDAGYTTETVIVTALLAVLGLAVLAIITVKVIAKANSINLG